MIKVDKKPEPEVMWRSSSDVNNGLKTKRIINKTRLRIFVERIALKEESRGRDETKSL